MFFRFVGRHVICFNWTCNEHVFHPFIIFYFRIFAQNNPMLIYYFTLLTKPIKPFEQKQFQSIVYNRNSISINVILNYSVSTRNTGKISIFPTQKTTRYSFRQAMNLNLFRGFLFSLSPTYSQTVSDTRRCCLASCLLLSLHNTHLDHRSQ